MIVFRFVHPAG